MKKIWGGLLLFLLCLVLFRAWLFGPTGTPDKTFEQAQRDMPVLFDSVPLALQHEYFVRLQQEYNEWHSFKKSVVKSNVTVVDERTKKLLGYAEGSFGEYLIKLSTDEDQLSRFIIEVIVAHLVIEFDLNTVSRSGYHFIRDYQRFKGKREEADFRDFAKELTGQEKFRLKNKLVQQYKIHLMPKLVDVYSITKQLLTELRTNPELQDVINVFKIMDKMTKEDLAREPHNITARMVLYPASGKENAQKALNIVHGLFGDVRGVGVPPRFNEKITDLIYVAQGDADDKLDLLQDKYKPISAGDIFQMPDMVYYNKNFTGKVQDYSLTKPLS